MSDCERKKGEKNIVINEGVLKQSQICLQNGLKLVANHKRRDKLPRIISSKIFSGNHIWSQKSLTLNWLQNSLILVPHCDCFVTIVMRHKSIP